MSKITKKELKSENPRWALWTYSWICKIIAVIIFWLGIIYQAPNFGVGETKPEDKMIGAMCMLLAVGIFFFVWAVRTIAEALFLLLDEMEKFNEE